MIAGPKYFPFHLEQFFAYLPAPGNPVFGPFHFPSDVENNGLLIFAKKSAAFFYRGHLGRAGTLFAVTAAAKSTFKTDPVGYLDLGSFYPAVLFETKALKNLFKLAVTGNNNSLLFSSSIKD